MTPTVEARRRAPEAELMDPRIAHRRRTVEMDRDRRRRRRVIVASVIIVIGAAVWFVLHSSIADVDSVRVEGNSRTMSGDILTVSGVEVGEPLVDVRTGEIRERVELLPWVSRVTVHVGWRGEVVISVTEREPVATISGSGDRVVALDATGRVLGEIEPRDDLMPIEGPVQGEPGGEVDQPTLAALRVVVALPPGVRTRVRSVSVGPDGVLSLMLRPDGVVILGPDEDMDSKLVSLTTVLGQVDLTDLAAMDLSVADQPVVTRRSSSPAQVSSSSTTVAPAPAAGTGTGTGTTVGKRSGG